MAKSTRYIDAKGMLLSQLWEDEKGKAAISIDDRVLLVGPGVWRRVSDRRKIAFPMDTALMFLANHLQRGSGTLTVLDLPPGNVRGCCKDWVAVKNLLDSLRAKGAGLCRYYFEEGYVNNPKVLAGGAFTAIIDHYTWHWHNPLLVGKKLDALLSQYDRLLDPGGRAFIFDRKLGDDLTYCDTIARRARELGFSADVWVGFVDRYALHDQVVLQWVLKDNYLQSAIVNRNEMNPAYNCKWFALLKKRSVGK
ncbi:hypothetical protein HYV84_03715 [Candidatus Woesearchaeota archaeon]|nr:hypothetical protein [Candidatus Woesearchaeota archaeon]